MHGMEKMGWSFNNGETLSGLGPKLKLNPSESVLVFTW